MIYFVHGRWPQTSPDDVAVLKAALALSEERRQRTEADLAVAKAMASEDKALIAHQALRIAKLERQIYGPRKERSAQLRSDGARTRGVRGQRHRG